MFGTGRLVKYSTRCVVEYMTSGPRGLELVLHYSTCEARDNPACGVRNKALNLGEEGQFRIRYLPWRIMGQGHGDNLLPSTGDLFPFGSTANAHRPDNTLVPELPEHVTDHIPTDAWTLPLYLRNGK